MEVKSVNSNPNFGIKYVNKMAWNLNVIEAFEKSKLLKEIDAKYPNASTFYNKFNQADWDIVNGEDVYTVFFDIMLAPAKRFCLNLSSHNWDAPDKHLIKALNTLTLKDVEREAVADHKPISAIEIMLVKKSNIFQRFFNRLFGANK